MKIVITGGSGFIGMNLAEWLCKHEPESEVLLLDIAPPTTNIPESAEYVYGDVRSITGLLHSFEGADEVYHLAGVLGTSELLMHVSTAIETNIGGTANVLEAAYRCGVGRVYNVAKPQFSSLHENTYTLTKHTGELLSMMYRGTTGLKVTSTRWLNAVGRYQHLYPVRKLVPTLVLFALRGVPLEIYGNGGQTIDPIDARDLCRFTVYACRNQGLDSAIVDVGSGQAISCNDVAREVLLCLREDFGLTTNSKVVHLPMRAGEAEGTCIKADTSFWDGLGMTPDYSFRDTLREVFDDILGRPSYELDNAMRFYGK